MPWQGLLQQTIRLLLVLRQITCEGSDYGCMHETFNLDRIFASSFFFIPRRDGWPRSPMQVISTPVLSEEVNTSASSGTSPRSASPHHVMTPARRSDGLRRLDELRRELLRDDLQCAISSLFPPAIASKRSLSPWMRDGRRHDRFDVHLGN
jgi:hypothetical protein